jgi:hypothetical protein
VSRGLAPIELAHHPDGWDIYRLSPESRASAVRASLTAGSNSGSAWAHSSSILTQAPAAWARASALAVSDRMRSAVLTGADLARQVRRQDLDDDLSVERALGGDEEPAHPAGWELALYPI